MSERRDPAPPTYSLALDSRGGVTTLSGVFNIAHQQEADDLIHKLRALQNAMPGVNVDIAETSSAHQSGCLNHHNREPVLPEVGSLPPRP